MSNVLARRGCVQIRVLIFLPLLWLDYSFADSNFLRAGSLAKESVEELSCPVCHGSLWQGNTLLASPNLTILPNWYIEAQIKSYQLGWRQRAQQADISDDMAAVARDLSNNQILLALEVVNALKPIRLMSSNDINDADRALGKLTYAACEACHGRDGMGLQSLGAPPLAGQRPEYLKAQLIAFGEGSRGANSADVFGQQMANALAWPMTAESLEALVNYISTL